MKPQLVPLILPFLSPLIQKALTFNGSPIDSFIKLNAYVADNHPLCHVFETDISSWVELRECIGSSNIIAALYSRHIYCFANTDHINAVFGNHIKSAIKLEPVEERILRKSDSIYIGLLYQLLKHYLISKGMTEYRKNKYYDSHTASNKSGCIFYKAVEIAISYI